MTPGLKNFAFLYDNKVITTNDIKLTIVAHIQN